MTLPAPTVLWQTLRREVLQLQRGEPVLAEYLDATVLNHETIQASLCHLLAGKLSSPDLAARRLRPVLVDALNDDPSMTDAACADLAAALERDPTVQGIAHPFLNHKGFHALQASRLAHWLWQRQRKALALHLQCRISEVFAVDIHPAARIGRGVFIDHATGVVIGETAVVADNVSILQDVTLGGTGKDTGDRHPKVEEGVLLCAGAKVLGNIRIGAGSKVGAGSVVLHDVPLHTTVVGVPARPVGRPTVECPALDMDQQLDTEPLLRAVGDRVATLRRSAPDA